MVQIEALKALVGRLRMGPLTVALRVSYYLRRMIRAIKDSETRRLWNREFSKRFQSIERTARVRLEFLHAARSLEDLRLLPGVHLEALKGDRRGQHSIRINKRYRVCFVWLAGDAHDVEIVDYH